jgi:peptidoglycan/LPS O-acetylase OafA/YrhL
MKLVRQGERFPELDSLRGLAAIAVVLHHFKLMFYRAELAKGTLSFVTYPFTAGHEAVTLFFLLSGFVLALPYLRHKEQPYPVFMARRVLRIYGPYIAALFLSVVGCAIWHHASKTDPTWSMPVSTLSVAQSIGFIGNYNFFRYNTAFWSLVYEMRISIIFPLLVLFALRFRARWVLLIALICTFDFSATPLVTMECAGMFIGGILLAKHIGSIGAAYSRLAKVTRVALAVLAFAVFNEAHFLIATPLWRLGYLPITLGAAGLIVVALYSRTISAGLCNATPLWLGKISYSMYLVHGTVLYALAAMLGSRINHLMLFAIYLPAAILLSWGFYFLVEAPFTRMSRKVTQNSPELVAT